MGFFNKLFGKKKEENQDSLTTFVVDEAVLQFDEHSLQAQQTFKYFWRELSWDYQRIVPALDLASVKVCFQQQIAGEIAKEFMWINNIEFDGEIIKGVLVNQPLNLTNIKQGDEVNIKPTEIADWLFVMFDKTYGGFTIQAIRKSMDKEERAQHDASWGLNFGDFNQIQYVYEQEKAENLIDHPMSRNVAPEYEKHLAEYSNLLHETDEDGYSLLHHNAIAGNLALVEVMLKGHNRQNG